MVNRRNFIKNILVAGAAFQVLPSAGRIWVATRAPIVCPVVLEWKWAFGSGVAIENSQCRQFNLDMAAIEHIRRGTLIKVADHVYSWKNQFDTKQRNLSYKP